ncbi:MAG: hypothetical protein CENE_01834 [Candidatus Celerinatantimonas neptuna]|nr:MAG: hypothetical protein CENE_01834 [Candidatus Celerinatantimonas neptuna]
MGVFINWLLVANIDPNCFGNQSLGIFIGYFASCLFGIYLFNSSEKPIISFVGYNFVVVPFGLIVKMVVSVYDNSLVIEAIRITAGCHSHYDDNGFNVPKVFSKNFRGFNHRVAVSVNDQVVSKIRLRHPPRLD